MIVFHKEITGAVFVDVLCNAFSDNQIVVVLEFLYDTFANKIFWCNIVYVLSVPSSK